MNISWLLHGDGDDTVTFSVTLDQEVGFLACGVSKEGSMVIPEPSNVVVGQDTGVRKHLLNSKALAGVNEDTRPGSDLSDTSYVRGSGATSASRRSCAQCRG